MTDIGLYRKKILINISRYFVVVSYYNLTNVNIFFLQNPMSVMARNLFVKVCAPLYRVSHKYATRRYSTLKTVDKDFTEKRLNFDF